MTDPGRRLAPPTAITAEQMADLDRIMLDELGIAPLQLMEIAGHAVATFTRDRLLDGDASGKRVLALAGNGGNGGDALVAARLLTAWGAMVTIVIARPPDVHSGLAAHQLDIARRWGISVQTADDDTALDPAGAAADLILDGLLGFSLHGDPRGATATLIERANAHDAPTLAIDLPSGLEATTGVIRTPCIRARTTLTLAMTKTGLLTPGARTVLGDLWVADIGVPPVAFGRVGLSFASAPFATGAFHHVFDAGGVG
ncbi:MAG: NAD(P)H-hydrate epimerase [Chloroflexota bacterium]|nr:NAD(P)H-hydrate epimerase [Chloroflexota bacterium]